MKKYFEAGDVVGLYKKLEAKSINIWLDGGWGVDALLGEQTRLHDDLDVVIEQRHVKKLREYLSIQGYVDIQRDDASDWNFVMGDNEGRQVDIHVITFDKAGNGIYGPIERNVFYPGFSLSGHGKINGIEVRCLTPEYQVASHTGYDIKEKDKQDVVALCDKFGIENPHLMKKITRRSCRAILLTPENEILLLKLHNPESNWTGWITPGGGIEGVETPEQAIRREMKEEVGLDGFDLGSLVWKREHSFPWGGAQVTQFEQFYLIRVDKFKPKCSHALSDIELNTMKGFKWWSIAEIRESNEFFSPNRLADYLSDLIASSTHDKPLDIDV